MTRQRIVLLILIAIGLVIAELVQYGTGFGGKTLWDWLGILIVPTFLLIGGIVVNSSIQRNEQARDDDRLKEQALQNFLDHMGELLLKEHLADPDAGIDARIVARAQTLTTLRGLDGERKAVVVRFLFESNLITGSKPIIDLSTADLEGVNLEIDNLDGVNLNGVNLAGAHLGGAHLEGAHLVEARLNGADVSLARLSGANLFRAKFSDSNLSGTQFDGANLEEVSFSRANLEAASFKETHAEGAFFWKANVKGAYFLRTHLEGAYFVEANVERTHFVDVNLKDVGINQKQLNMARIDELTILPNHLRRKASSLIPSYEAQALVEFEIDDEDESMKIRRSLRP